MPLTDNQKKAIQTANGTANRMATRLLYAINRPHTAILDLEQLDPTEDHTDAIGMVNGSKAAAIAICIELQAYLENLPDLS